MINLLSSFWAPNWDQFWPSIIATGIGFILAILFQQLLYEVIKNKIVNYRKSHTLINEIKKELDRCLLLITELDFKISYLNPVKTPVWDGAINNNEIQLLATFKKVKLSKYYKKQIAKSKFKNECQAFLNEIESKKKYINLYDRLFIIYGAISDFNGWYNVKSDKKAQGIEVKTEDIIASFLLLLKEDLTAESCLDDRQNIRKQYKKSIYILSRLIACTVSSKNYAAELKDINLSDLLTKEDFI